MTALVARIWRRLRYALRRGRDAELLEELETHRALRQQQLERDGFAPPAAAAASRYAMGNLLLVREDVREVWLGAASSWLGNLRAGIRLLRSHPITSLGIVVTMALAIATTAVVAAVFDASVRRPLPYPDGNRLVWVTNHDDRFGHDTLAARGDTELWRQRVPTFERLGAYGLLQATLDAGGRVSRESIATFDADMWPLLGMRAAYGRLFGPGEHDLAVISHALFERLSGVQARVVGSSIAMNGRPMTVIGVLPRQAPFLLPGADVAPTLYLPLPRRPALPGVEDRAASGEGPVAPWLRVIARLRSETTIDEARAQFASVHAAIAKDYPTPRGDRSPRVTPLHEKITAPAVAPLRLLLGAVICLLIMAAANMAILLVVQTGSRRAELAVRVSLGAGMVGIVRQLLAEGVVLAALATSAGLVIGRWLLAAVATTWPHAAPRLTDAAIDRPVVLLTVVAGSVSAVVFGLAPMLVVWRRDLVSGLRRSDPGEVRGRTRPATGMFVATQFLAATVLLVAAMLGARSYWVTVRDAAVFDPDRVLVAGVSLSGQRYASRNPQEEYFDAVLRVLETTPQIQAAGLDAGSFTGPIFTSASEPGADAAPAATIRPVSAGFLPAIGARLLRGRWPRPGALDARDVESTDALLVNSAFVRTILAGRDPLGVHVRGPFISGTIAAVVDDFKDWRLDAAPVPQIFVPFKRALVLRSARIVVRAEGDPTAVASVLRQRIREADRTQAVADFEVLGDVLAASVMPRRFQLALFAAFASLAVVLALTGIFGIVAHGVGQRTREIAVRLAFGAHRRQVVAAAVIRQLGFALGGIAVGAVAMLTAAPMLEPLVDQVSPRDPTSFVVVVGLLGTASIAMAIGATARVARVSPMTLLKG